jgi:hypothetical protein
VPETIEIPRNAWHNFFSRFSQAHETQFVAVEVMGHDLGAQVEGRLLLFSGISEGDRHDESLALMFDALHGEHLTHMVQKPTRVRVRRAADNTDEALEIQSSDGITTLVRFPAAEAHHADTLKGAERFPRKGNEDL